EEQNYFPSEKIKTLLCLVYLVFSFFATLLTVSIIHERVPDQDKYGPLSDIILDLLPRNDRLIEGSEIVITITTSIALPMLFIFHKYRFIMLRRIFVITGLLYCMRCVTMFVTVLPASTSMKYCAPKSNDTNPALWLKRAWALGTGFGLVINGKHKYCGDLIFSGHTVILCMGSLVISEYTPRKLFILHWASWIATLLGIIMILWSHQHYTIDIIIAYFATTRLFWLYHMLANDMNLRESSRYNYISRIWWFRIIQYLEKNVKAPVPAVLEFPFPITRKCFRRRRSEQ
ncbi:Phosphatidylcholine:ceramide cholinephosphotransferase 2, partial [Blattella germanica]